MNSTNEKEIVARVKKTHAMLNEALGRAVAKYGSADTWCTSLPTGIDCGRRTTVRVTEFMQVEQDCFTHSYQAGDCMGANYEDFHYYKVRLSDGMGIAFIDENYGFLIYIDIDGGKKGKDEPGKDIFAFNFDKSSNIINAPEYIYRTSLAVDCKNANAVAWACSRWILQYDNADYLQIDSSGKCPNGTVLSDSNPTCN